MAKWYENFGLGFIQGTNERLARERLQKREDELEAQRVEERKMEFAESERNATERHRKTLELQDAANKHQEEMARLQNKKVLDMTKTNAENQLIQNKEHWEATAQANEDKYNKKIELDENKNKILDETKRAEKYNTAYGKLHKTYIDQIDVLNSQKEPDEQLTPLEKERLWNKMENDLLATFYPDKWAEKKPPDVTPELIEQIKAKIDALPNPEERKAAMKEYKEGPTYWHYDVYRAIQALDKSLKPDKEQAKIYKANGINFPSNWGVGQINIANENSPFNFIDAIMPETTRPSESLLRTISAQEARKRMSKSDTMNEENLAIARRAKLF